MARQIPTWAGRHQNAQYPFSALISPASNRLPLTPWSLDPMQSTANPPSADNLHPDGLSFDSSTFLLSQTLPPSSLGHQEDRTLSPSLDGPSTWSAAQLGPAGGSASTGRGLASPTIKSVFDNATFYHPMNRRSPNHPRTQDEIHALLLRGFSPNYRGDPELARNQSATIPPEANCSLFLVGLAPDLTTHELLSGIRNTGRVYATHINPPDPERGHSHSAAKLIFFERAGAGKSSLAPKLTAALIRTERFFSRYSPTGYATPRNPHLRARVTWNRVRSAEADVNGSRSRVLLVSGPPGIVNQDFLFSYLGTKMVYQVDDVLYHGQNEDGSRVLLEIRFGSFRCQAEAARMALMREFRDAGVICDYGKPFWALCVYERTSGLSLWIS
ncbi:uncharacterized protein P884DRAFT_317204 [Thermothelomyces heterothallicus CBS 202.75]|uniref:uncharacterized protein n=1 Tax=Thermothelomyces heterothallicus CBS 202.75 TaxID=1149848 RepID=UPI003743FFF3